MSRPRRLQVGELAETQLQGTPEKMERVLQLFREAITPPRKMDLDEWADNFRMLPRETSSEYGRWKTSRFPFLRKIMKALSPSSRAREVTAIKGAQLGFTEVAINWILYGAHQNPGPMMYVQKTDDAAKDFATQKLEPSIAACPELDRIMGAQKPKSLSNEVTNKGFPGGFVVLGGSNSGAFLRSKSIRDAIADEEDSYKANIDGEGSPVGMIRKRQANFPLSKFFRLSTPKFKETSTIEPAFDAGSQEQYYVPCPECNPGADLVAGTKFVIRWGNIKWSADIDPESNLPRDIYLVCEQCGCAIPEHKKTWMLENGDWFSEKESNGKPYRVGDVEFPSFQISSLYSPLGFFSWRDAVKEWFEYKNTQDKALLQVFINQTLGESYSAAGQDISANWLHGRRESYLTRSAPALPWGTLVLTAGVDIQDDRIEVEVVAWGLHAESWSVDYSVLYGVTDTLGDYNGLDSTGRPTAFTLLDQHLERTWSHANGQQVGVECTLIDSGHRAEVVHVFCRTKEHRRIFPVRGRAGWGRGRYERPKRRHERFKTWLFIAWVDEMKDTVYGQLQVDQPGPGYCHFPDSDPYTQKYFQGLTAENKRVKMVSGKKVLFWECPRGVRNEPLDCRVYAQTALHVYSPNMEHRAKLMGLGDAGIQIPEPDPPVRQFHRVPKKRVASPGL